MAPAADCSWPRPGVETDRRRIAYSSRGRKNAGRTRRGRPRGFDLQAGRTGQSGRGRQVMTAVAPGVRSAADVLQDQELAELVGRMAARDERALACFYDIAFGKAY